jgi:hypothetical protein
MSSKLIKNNCRIADKKRIVYSFLCFSGWVFWFLLVKNHYCLTRMEMWGDGELKREIKVNCY